MNFNGKTALITGASVGIGRATAISIAQKGAEPERIWKMQTLFVFWQVMKQATLRVRIYRLTDAERSNKRRKEK